MKRGRIHMMFGCAALGLALLAAYYGVQLQNANRVNDAIARADTSLLDSSVPEAVSTARSRLGRLRVIPTLTLNPVTDPTR